VNRSLIAGVCVSVVSACGSQRPRDDRKAPVPIDAPLPPNAETCPTTFVSATGSCTTVGASSMCNYPEGTCSCSQPSQCSGMDRSDEPPEPTSWQCMRFPPKVRPDGCPGAMAEGACSTEGKTCSYAQCCSYTFTCTGGAWQRTSSNCPP
jgi:hypothetical protein